MYNENRANRENSQLSLPLGHWPNNISNLGNTLQHNRKK